LGTFVGIDGSGTVVTIDFTVDDYGTTILDLNNTLLGDPFAEPIIHETNDGFFRNNPQTHDVAVIYVETNVTATIYSGKAVNITVVVENQGDFFETFAVAALNETSMAAPAQIVTDLPPRKNQTLYFIWDTPGVADGTYTIKGMADTVTGETDLDDNIKEDGTVTITHVAVHDIAITAVTPFTDTIPSGETMTINVTVTNEGTETETFNVTAYYDETVIGMLPVSDLASGAEQMLVFTWNTTDVSEGTYIVRANASLIEGETDTADNIKEDGTLTVLPVVHDIAVTSVSASPDTVTAGQTVSVTVIVKNEGETEETFDVVVRCNGTEIGTQTVANLAAGNEQTLTFTWDTTGVVVGTYTIEAEASTVAGETDTDDNIKEGGTVTVQEVLAPTVLLYGAIVVILVAAAIIGYFVLIRMRKSGRT